MSTVAWDGRILAADTQCTTGKSFISQGCKLYDLPSYAMGITGYFTYGHQLALWLCGQRPDIPQCEEEWYCSALVYNKRTHQMYGFEWGYFTFIYEDYAALGSGRETAYAFLKDGKNAKQAIRMAMQADTNTGGEVMILPALGKGKVLRPLILDDLLSFPRPILVDVTEVKKDAGKTDPCVEIPPHYAYTTIPGEIRGGYNASASTQTSGLLREGGPSSCEDLP